MKKWLPSLFSLALFAKTESSPSAQPALSLAAVPVTLSEADDIESKVTAIEGRIQELKTSLKIKARALHKIKNSALVPAYMWESERDLKKETKKKANLEKMLQISIRIHTRELEELERRVVDLKSEQEWVRLQQDEEKELVALSQSLASEVQKTKSAEALSLKCQLLPFAMKDGINLKLIKDFGLIKDKDTGLEWNSKGWWLGGISGEVKTCAAGTVAYVGKVSGRGRVVMIDHGGGRLSLYANLAEDPHLKLARGTRMAEGASLGTALSKLYFEVRQKGVALNPREVFASDWLSRVGL